MLRQSQHILIAASPASKQPRIQDLYSNLIFYLLFLLLFICNATAIFKHCSISLSLDFPMNLILLVLKRRTIKINCDLHITNSSSFQVSDIGCQVTEEDIALSLGPNCLDSDQQHLGRILSQETQQFSSATNGKPGHYFLISYSCLG